MNQWVAAELLVELLGHLAEEAGYQHQDQREEFNPGVVQILYESFAFISLPFTINISRISTIKVGSELTIVSSF